MSKRHLIIGAGHAGVNAAGAIRKNAPQDEIIIINNEDTLPYSPASLDHLLSGGITENELWLKDESFFRSLDVKFIRNNKVNGLDPLKKSVNLQDGTEIPYDNLLIATGSEPAVPPIDGISNIDVCSLRTLADCRNLLYQSGRTNKVVILGAGMVGMKIAAALLERGVAVTLLEKEDKILSQYFNDEAEEFIKTIFKRKGTQIITGTDVKNISKTNGDIRLELHNGNIINTGVLVNATGMKSRTELLAGAGIRTNKGILVDDSMRTSATGIFAAGDVVETRCFFSGEREMSGIIPNAVSQGMVAGIVMAGGEATYRGNISMTAFNFLGNQAFSIGRISPPGNSARVVKQVQRDRLIYKKLIFDDDILIGGMFLNENVNPGMLLYLIKNKIDMSPYKEALFKQSDVLSDPWLKTLAISN